VSVFAAKTVMESKLYNLRELHLLMFGMANSNLADIYSFLKTCPCPQLERLFVQVATCLLLCRMHSIVVMCMLFSTYALNMTASDKHP
jgi:hypothetical protein